MSKATTYERKQTKRLGRILYVLLNFYDRCPGATRKQRRVLLLDTVAQVYDLMVKF